MAQQVERTMQGERSPEASSAREQGLSAATTSASSAQPSKADQALSLLSAINHLRVARQALEAQDLHGAVEDVALAQHNLRRKLQLLQEEGLGVIELPREEFV